MYYTVLTNIVLGDAIARDISSHLWPLSLVVLSIDVPRDISQSSSVVASFGQTEPHLE